MMVNWKAVGVTAAIIIGGGIGGYGLGYRHSVKANDPTECIAGPGEICPSVDFAQELKNLKKLGERQRSLSQDPKVKELIEVMDTQRGMAERMQGEINQTLQANPGHQWDGQKEKFVPGPPVPAPVPASAPPAPTPSKK